MLTFHTTYVSDIERGHRNVGLINLDRLALSIDVATLIGEAQSRRAG